MFDNSRLRCKHYRGEAASAHNCQFHAVGRGAGGLFLLQIPAGAPKPHLPSLAWSLPVLFARYVLNRMTL